MIQRIRSDPGHRDETLQSRKDASSLGVKDDVLNAVFILGAGYLFKFIFQRITKSPVKRILGNTFLLGITNIAIKNPESVRSFRKGILQLFRKKGTKKVSPA
jgi:hypothetical protein